jgi:hypothetical protein
MTEEVLLSIHSMYKQTGNNNAAFTETGITYP